VQNKKHDTKKLDKKNFVFIQVPVCWYSNAIQMQYCINITQQNKQNGSNRKDIKQTTNQPCKNTAFFQRGMLCCYARIRYDGDDTTS
jgi:hypothetical protein